MAATVARHNADDWFVRSIQVITSIAREAAGPGYTVRRLAEALAERGVDSEIFSTGTPSETHLKRALSRVFPTDHGGMPIVQAAYASRALRTAIGTAVREGAVLHSHGLWRMPNLYPGWAAARYNAPLVVSPQ